MRSSPALIALTAAVLALAGCLAPAPSGTGTAPVQTASSTAPQALAPSVVTLSGIVMAPAGVIAAGAGNVIAAGAGNVIAPGAGNVIAPGAGNFKLFATGDWQEQAVAGVLVTLADAAGEPFEEIEPVVAGPDGTFSFPNLPEGEVFRLLAHVEQDGKAATFETLAHTDGQSGADIDSATTLLTSALVEEGEAAVGELDPAEFVGLVAETKLGLTAADLPADWSDRARVREKAEAIAAKRPALKDRLDKVRKRWKETKKPLAEVRSRVGARLKQRAPLPQVAHTFTVASNLRAAAYPLRVELRRPRSGETVAALLFSAPGATVKAEVREGRPFSVWITRSHDTAPRPRGFLMVPVGAPDAVELELGRD